MLGQLHKTKTHFFLFIFRFVLFCYFDVFVETKTQKPKCSMFVWRNSIRCWIDLINSKTATNLNNRSNKTCLPCSQCVCLSVFVCHIRLLFMSTSNWTEFVTTRKSIERVNRKYYYRCQSRLTATLLEVLLSCVFTWFKHSSQQMFEQTTHFSWKFVFFLRFNFQRDDNRNAWFGVS